MSQEVDGLKAMARAASDMLDWLFNNSTVRGRWRFGIGTKAVLFFARAVEDVM